MINSFDYEDINISLSDIKKEKMKRNFKKTIIRNKNRKRIIAATTIVALTGSFTLTNESVLAKVNNIGRKIENFLYKEEDSFEKYKKDILEISEDKGIKFMFHEAMLDDEELYISASIDYNKFDSSDLKTKHNRGFSIIPNLPYLEFQTYSNGEKIDIIGSGCRYEYNDDGTVDMLLTVDMENNDLNEIYDVSLGLNTMEVQIPYKEHEFIDGEWALNFQVDGSKIANEVRVIDINKEIEIEYKDMKFPIVIEELRISPVSIKFKYNVDIPFSITKAGKRLDFDLLDQDGEKIESHSGRGRGDSFMEKYVINKDISKIKIVPKIAKYNRFWKNEKVFEGKAIEIDIN